MVIRKTARAEDTGSARTPSQAEAVLTVMDEIFSKTQSSDSSLSGTAMVKQFQKKRLATHSYLCAIDNQIVLATGVWLLRCVGPSSVA